MTERLHYEGLVRLYFNRHASDGRVWCVEAAGAEIAVFKYVLVGTNFETMYESQDVVEGPKRHDGPPSAWLEGLARLTIEHGVAMLHPYADTPVMG
jgi:hypothetical protein